MQVQPKAFRYEIRGVEAEPFFVILLVSCGTVARMALSQQFPKEQFPNASFMLKSVTERIMQINEGAFVLEGETKIISDECDDAKNVVVE